MANFVAPAGAIGISLVIIFLIAWPKFTQVLNLREVNRELATRAASLNQKAQDLANLNKEDLEVKLSGAESLLPSDKEVFSLVTQVENAARSSGVLLSRLETAPGTIGEGQANIATKGTSAPVSQQPGGGSSFDAGIPKIQIKISLAGDYKSYLQFINLLLSLPRVVAIRDLAVSSSSSSGQSSQLRISLTIDAYWQPLPKELASIESPISELTPQETETLRQIKTTEESVGVPSAAVPVVPLGRLDLFAPF